MLDIILNFIIKPSLMLLPFDMQSQEAEALLLSIGQQESRFEHRRQIIRTSSGQLKMLGPARGGWQFEKIGLVEVMTNRITKPHFENICNILKYPKDFDFVFEGITHNDMLACCAARLLLWPDAAPLPKYEDGPEVAWQYYIRRWRPGKPHRNTWDEFWNKSWAIVKS